MIALRIVSRQWQPPYTWRRHSPIAQAPQWCVSAPNHSVHQVIEHGLKVAALPGMYGRGLHDGALWRDQPMKSLARRQLSDGSRLRPARADRRNGRESAPDQLEIHAGVEREQHRLVEFDARLQNPLYIAGKNNSGTDELAALDARDDPHDRIIIGAKIVHASPPVRKPQRIASAGGKNSDTPLAVR